MNHCVKFVLYEFRVGILCFIAFDPFVRLAIALLLLCVLQHRTVQRTQMEMDRYLAVRMRMMMLGLLANTRNVLPHSSSIHWMLPSLPFNDSSSLVTLAAMTHPSLR